MTKQLLLPEFTSDAAQKATIRRGQEE